MDSKEPSSGVVRFLDFIKEKGEIKKLKGIEMGCGKGRNVIWLAKQGIAMTGFDFSPSAIQEARKRPKKSEKNDNITFLVHDATKRWPFESNYFDLAIDCFATTDIETVKRRRFSVKEILRVLKPKGYLLVYAMSTDDEFHKKMLKASPAKEKNAFLHPTTGKFEKIFERKELLNLYSRLNLIKETRIKKTTVFFGKEYDCNHHWMIFQKS
jgi:ubiquinone/menaquinone biosynthesis C-methylase UbiE